MRCGDRCQRSITGRICLGALSFASLGMFGAAASGQTAKQEGEIDALLDKAVSAATAAEAEASVREAQSCLDAAIQQNKDALAAAYLQAEITRTQGKLHLAAWRQNRSDDALRQQAEEVLSDAYGQFRQAANLLREERQTRPDGKAVKPRPTARHGRLEEYNLRLQHALAWTEYELGLVTTDAHLRRRRFTDAVRRFASHFTATTYRSEPVLAHCFLGQALCLLELGQHAEAINLLKPAKNTNTRLDIYRQMVEVRIRAYQEMNDHKGASQVAWDYLLTRPVTRREAADWRIALTCARSLCTVLAAGPDSQLQARYRISLESLAGDVASAGEPWRSELDATLKDARIDSPLARLSRARWRFSTGDYTAALAEAEQALAAGSRAGGPQEAYLADLRFVQAAALWELGRWLEAHRTAAAFLKQHPADPREDRMAQCALQAGLNALKAQPPMEIAEFMRFVGSAATRPAATNPVGSGPAATTAPAQTVGAEAAFHGGSVLFEQGRYSEAEQLFQAVPLGSPFYLRAQYGLALSGWRQLEGKTIAASRPAQAKDPTTATLAALTRFFQAAHQELRDEDRPTAGPAVELATLVVKHLIEREPPDLPHAARLLENIESLPQTKSRNDRLLLALRVEIAVLAANPDPASPIVQFIIQKRPTTEDLTGVLTHVSKSINRRCQGLTSRQRNDEATRLRNALLDVYRNLLTQMTAGQGSHIRQHEAAIRGQFARMLHEVGLHSEAVTHYRWLEKNAPRTMSAETLRGFALACEESGQHDPAVAIWGRLSKSLPPHTEAWYEARYHQIDCYHRAGLSDHARKLLDYFLLQNPEIKVEVWRQKFEDLRQKLPNRRERTGGKG